MDFAPYQSDSPDTSRRSLNIKRPFSPPIFGSGGASNTTGNGATGSRGTYSPSPNNSSTPPPQSSLLLPPPVQAGATSSSFYTPWGRDANGRQTVEQFETSLPIRLDYEAMLAYILLPPAGGVLLLILEHKSDFVRFHAWQSSLLFSALVLLHFIFSFSSFISYTLLLTDLGLIGYLSMAAYRDADTLDRCEVPFFGPLASSILDDE